MEGLPVNKPLHRYIKTDIPLPFKKSVKSLKLYIKYDPETHQRRILVHIHPYGTGMQIDPLTIKKYFEKHIIETDDGSLLDIFSAGDALRLHKSSKWRVELFDRVHTHLIAVPVDLEAEAAADVGVILAPALPPPPPPPPVIVEEPAPVLVIEAALPREFIDIVQFGKRLRSVPHLSAEERQRHIKIYKKVKAEIDPDITPDDYMEMNDLE